MTKEIKEIIDLVVKAIIIALAISGIIKWNCVPVKAVEPTEYPKTILSATLYSINGNDITIETKDGNLWTWEDTDTNNLYVGQSLTVTFMSDYSPSNEEGTIANISYLDSTGNWSYIK